MNVESNVLDTPARQGSSRDYGQMDSLACSHDLLHDMALNSNVLYTPARQGSSHGCEKKGSAASTWCSSDSLRDMPSPRKAQASAT